MFMYKHIMECSLRGRIYRSALHSCRCDINIVEYVLYCLHSISLSLSLPFFLVPPHPLPIPPSSSLFLPLPPPSPPPYSSVRLYTMCTSWTPPRTKIGRTGSQSSRMANRLTLTPQLNLSPSRTRPFRVSRATAGWI